MAQLCEPIRIVDDGQVRSRLSAPERLRGLHRSRLLDAPAQENFDRILRILARVLDVPVVLLSILDEDRQFFKGALGLQEPWDSARETPLTHSYCKFVVANDAPLVVEDIAEVIPAIENGATSDLGVVAYLGVPIHDREGVVLGALCAIDRRPRRWTSSQLDVLRDLGHVVESEVGLRSQLERAGNLEAGRRDTLAMLAHDLGAPLAAMVTAAKVLTADDGCLTRPVRDQVVAILDRQTDRAQELVHRLLLTEGALPTVRATFFDLVEELERIAQGARSIAPDTFIEVAEGGAAVVQDRMMLEQIVTNLVNNAVAHGGPGVAIRIEVEIVGSNVEVRVLDDGPGVSTENADRIFDCFNRRRGSEGHGLGLYIVRRVAAVLGGTVRLDDTGGEGAAFVVTLPRDLRIVAPRPRAGVPLTITAPSHLSKRAI